MSYCNSKSLVWVVELCKGGPLDFQTEGGLKRTAGSGIKRQLSMLKQAYPGCPGLGDGPRWFGASGREINGVKLNWVCSSLGTGSTWSSLG